MSAASLAATRCTSSWRGFTASPARRQRERPGGDTQGGTGYISRGWPAFVLSSSKTPVANCDRCRAEHTTPAQMEACDCLTCHGFYSATRDLGHVAEMIRLHPRGLLAIRTGAPSGTVVVDVDAPHGLPTMRQLIRDGMLPRTVVQRTGSEGYHLLYRYPGVRIPSGAGKGGTGVDIKADGGYIVAAPSVHPRTHKRYRWIGSCNDDLTPLPQVWVDRLGSPSHSRGKRRRDSGRPHWQPVCGGRAARRAGKAPKRAGQAAKLHAGALSVLARPAGRRWRAGGEPDDRAAHVGGGTNRPHRRGNPPDHRLGLPCRGT